MAKTTPKRAKVKPIRANQPPPDEPEGSDPAEPDGEPLTEDAPPPQAAQQAEPPHRGRPPGPRDPTQTTVMPFFRRVAAVNRDDWGTRYKIKVYRLAPIIDRLRGSENKYICIYEEPITEEKIKHDHGSGRYRLYLSCKSPANKEEKEVDRIEFDILDMNFPPKVPPGEWVEDARNKPWAWAKPKMPGEEAAAAATASGNMLEAVQVLGDLQDRAEERARDRIEAGRPQSWDPAAQLTAVANVARDMATALKATPENPVPQFLADQLNALRADVTAARARSDALMDKLLERATAPPQQNGGMGAIRELVSGIKDLLPEIKGLFPQTDEAIAGRVARSHMGPWQEFFQPVLPGLVNAIAPILPALAQRLSGSEPAPNGMPRPSLSLPIAAPGQPARMQPSEPNLDAMLLNALGNERSGADFADSILTLYGPLLYRQVCSLGEAGMLAMLQQRPVWAQLGALQSKMPQFIHEFVTYGEEGGPDEAEQTAAPGANADQPPIDLTAGVESGSTAGGIA